MAESTLYHASQAGPSLNSEKEWGYSRLFEVIIRRRIWLVSLILISSVGAAVLTLLQPPIYKSSVQFLIRSNYQTKSEKGEEDFSEPNVEVDTATQLKVLLTPDILQKAVDQLSSQYQDISVEEVLQSLTLSPLYSDATQFKKQVETNVWQASYQSNDPKKAQQALKAILDVYQIYNRQQQELRLSKGLAFINEQLPEVRKSLVAAEAALQEFRRRQGIIDPSEQAKVAATDLNRIRAERQQLAAEIQQVSDSARNIAQVVQTPSEARLSARLSESQSYQKLLIQQQEKKQELERQRQRLNGDHPELIQLESEYQALVAQLEQEAKHVLGQANSTEERAGSALVQGQFSRDDLSLASQLTELQKNLAGLKARDQSLATTEVQLRTELAQYPELIAQYNRLQPEVETRRETLQKLLEARQELGLEIARGGLDWTVLESPQLGEQIGPSLKRNLLLGIVVGVFLGSVTAFLRESLDDTLHSSDALGEQIPLPLLGMVPELTLAEAKNAILPIPFNKNITQLFTTPELFQWQPLQESLDLIYTNLQLIKVGALPKSLMITSSLAGEGKSTIALGLAISAARQDQRVLLIDADLRRPSLHNIFHLDNFQGLSTLLTGNVSTSDLKSTPQWAYLRWDTQIGMNSQEYQILPSDVSLDVLTSGPISVDPIKLLGQERIREVIEAFEDSYDLILIDSPPVLGVVDAIPVGLGCDGVVMVARVDRIKQAELSKAISMLNRLNVIGLVANGVQQSARTYSGYSYSPRGD